jgi:hypothetical protein
MSFRRMVFVKRGSGAGLILAAVCGIHGCVNAGEGGESTGEHGGSAGQATDERGGSAGQAGGRGGSAGQATGGIGPGYECGVCYDGRVGFGSCPSGGFAVTLCDPSISGVECVVSGPCPDLGNGGRGGLGGASGGGTAGSAGSSPVAGAANTGGEGGGGGDGEPGGEGGAR